MYFLNLGVKVLNPLNDSSRWFFILQTLMTPFKVQSQRPLPPDDSLTSDSLDRRDVAMDFVSQSVR